MYPKYAGSAQTTNQNEDNQYEKHIFMDNLNQLALISYISTYIKYISIKKEKGS